MIKRVLLILILTTVAVLVIIIVLSRSAVHLLILDGKRGVMDSLIHEDQVRDFVVHLPDSVYEKDVLPVIMAFHGAGGSGIQFLNQTNLDYLSDKHDFIAVFPNAPEYSIMRRRLWNVRTDNSQGHMADDVGFVSSLIDHLIEHYNADANRIYVTGTSNGGIFSYRLLCELSHKITAIATNAGVDAYDGDCLNFHPRSILHVHDINDRLVPIEGKRMRRFDLPSVESTFKEWGARLGCNNNNPMLLFEDSIHQIFQYSGCDEGAQMLYYLTNDGGHGWPGSEPRSILASKPSKAFDMNELIWSFFKTQHLN